MQTKNPDSLTMPHVDNCAINQPAYSKQAIFTLSLLNRWIGSNRCASLTFKKLASILPLSLVLVQMQMPNARAVALTQCSNVSFRSAANFAVRFNPFPVIVSDFDGDGKQDLAAANYISNNISVLKGNGDGTFQSVANFAVGSSPRSVTVGDFDGDGKQDLTVVNSSSNNVSVLKGNGDGTFQSAANFAVGFYPFSVTIGDFDSDAKQDLAAADYNSNNVSVLKGNGDGTFRSAANFAVGSGPRFVTVGDFNGDGKQDLATANSNYENVSVLKGNGDGTFQSAANFAVGISPRSVTVGDFNGDGKQDLAAATYNSGTQSNTVSVLLNNCIPVAPPDNTPPSVTVNVTTSASSKQLQITAQNSGSGIASVVVTSSHNAKVTIPNFQVGTKSPVIVSTEQNDSAKGLSFQVQVTDTAGNVGTSDLATLLVRDTGKPVSLPLTKVLQQQNIVQIFNGTPGPTNLRLSVNGTKFQAGDLVDNEVRVLDVSSALQLNNTLTLKALGKSGGTAFILIREPSTP